METLLTVARVQGTRMAPARGVESGEWTLVLLTDDGVVADRLALSCLGRGGVRLLGEWASLARPADADVWAMLDALPHTERATFLAMIDWDNGEVA